MNERINMGIIDFEPVEPGEYYPLDVVGYQPDGDLLRAVCYGLAIEIGGGIAAFCIGTYILHRVLQHMF